jgi:bifunctional DNase/RNase
VKRAGAHIAPAHDAETKPWYGSLTAVATRRDVTRVPVEMRIRGLGQSAPSGAPLVLLKEATGERHLAIGIGPLELLGIAAALAETPPPRPLTHDLLCSALAACGATVTRALIHRLVDGVFHARLTLDVRGRPAELDARSSDAIAVAVRVGLPILVEEAVLEQAGITPPTGAGAAEAPAEQAGQERIGEDQLGAFRDVIRGLDLDDLDRPGSSS